MFINGKNNNNNNCNNGDNKDQCKSKMPSQQSIFEKARLIAKKYKGECQSTTYSICKGKNSLKFKCLNGHTFFTAIDIIENIIIDKDTTKSVDDVATTKVEEWCYKCRKFYNTCKEVAAQHDIKVVGGLYNSKISLKCERRGHEFKISYTKKLNTLSCSDCRKEEREEWKEKLRQEELERNEQFQRQQRELFEQAKREMEGDANHCGGADH